MRRNHLAPGASVLTIYGNTTIERAYCPHCQTSAFVIDGKFACCDTPCSALIEGIHREVSPEATRKHLSKKVKDEILEHQGHRCFYCGMTFYSYVRRHGKLLLLTVHYDHRVPYAYSLDSHPYNFVAACHVCNLIKSDKIFQTIDEARMYLAEKRREKGYDF